MSFNVTTDVPFVDQIVEQHFMPNVIKNVPFWVKSNVLLNVPFRLYGDVIKNVHIELTAM